MHPYTLPADKTWRILESAIREIHNQNASGLSFEELYRCVWWGAPEHGEPGQGSGDRHIVGSLNCGNGGGIETGVCASSGCVWTCTACMAPALLP